jgi:hypothetical protein
MRALVVFESMFGNTEAIAQAVTEGLSSRADVTMVEVGAAPTSIDADIDLLVVGGPTHALSLSRPRTRQDARQRAEGPLVSPGIGLREWLASLDVRRRPPATAFDTRVRKPRLSGSAARAAVRRLRRLGFDLAAPAASFYVDGMTGPLLEGECDRARQWGDDLAARVGRPRVSRR